MQLAFGYDILQAPQVFSASSCSSSTENFVPSYLLPKDSLVRVKLDQHYYEIYLVVQQAVSVRWNYEQDIKRAFFHVKELGEEDLADWRAYIDFEEK
ncbi:hypothetical protein DM02DRAFT_45513 [Periconia macrospinosa]|uniref:Uncharacterized protein n=1 Tax=Periconia macrospinosa TaxID=97972 RepID=A0A2V1DMX3_9PLEO|nr:hypothetical protein DM02DRAFT_45513 [Periconia macrospinosa]